MKKLHQKYPDSITIMRDLIIMYLENNDKNSACIYCLKIQKYVVTSEVKPSISDDVFKYILGFSFWLIGDEKSAKRYGNVEEYYAKYKWLLPPINCSKPNDKEYF